jgi:hypothetical protein
MFCTKCGNKLEDDAVTCPKCGADVEPEPLPQPTVGDDVAKKNKQPVSMDTIKKLIGNKKVLGGIVGAVVLLVVIIIVATQPKKFDLEDYIEISYDGYNGYASASATLDRDALYEDIYKEIGEEEEIDDLEDLLEDSAQLVKAVSSIKLKVTSESKNLSNGDKITVSISYNNDIAKKSDIKFKGKTVTETVKDLESVEEIDPFEELEVSFTGISPNGSIELKYNGDNSYISTSSFSIDKRNGLRNGDEVTVSVESNDDYTLDYGYVIKKKEQKYTVSDLEEYIGEYKDLEKDFIDELKGEAEDTIYSYTAGEYNSSTSLGDLTYTGYILNSIKDTTEYHGGVYNDLYLIYAGTVSSSDEDFSATKVYFPVRFTNILKGNDGLSYEQNNGIVGSSSLDGTWFTTRGYNNPFSCYLAIVDANREDYTAECGDGFEDYSEYEEITKLADISEEYKKELYADAKDRIESYIASNYDSECSVAGLAIAGEYLLLAKTQGTDFGQNNKYFVVYSATVSNAENDFEPTTVYYPVEYDGVVKLPKDEYMVTATHGIVGNSDFPDSWYGTKGYIDGVEMYSKIVTTNRNKFKYDVSEGLKKFGK